jgi:hypothetical protein
VLQGWEAKELLYYGRHQKQPMTEMGISFETDLDKFLGKCDVVRAHATASNTRPYQPAVHPAILRLVRHCVYTSEPMAQLRCRF